MKTDDDFLKDISNTFFIESRENLEAFEFSLLEIEKGMYSKELMDSVFRSIHTIKGSSGMFGFGPIEKFTHVMENLLDDVRNELVEIDSAMITLLLECKDHIEILINLVENSGELTIEGDLLDTRNKLFTGLKKYFKNKDAAENKNDVDSNNRYYDETENDETDAVANTCWHISLRFGENVFRQGFDPCSFINYLNKIGDIKNIITITDALPTLDETDPESCYLGFEIDFHGDSGMTKEKIEDVFEFLKDSCLVRILSPRSSINDYIMLLDELPETSILIGEMLKKIGTLTETELEQVLTLQQEIKEKANENRTKPIGEILLDEKMVHKPILDAALDKQELVRKKHNTMRIDADKLDNLINQVGELVITGSSIKQFSDNEVLDRSNLSQSVASMSRLIEDIRDSTMSLRMVQIGETFKRFERITRDLSRERGKKVDLIVSGSETELDKTLIEKLTDPLMHIMRNAVDHGIDVPEERVKLGKSPNGEICLNAYHETGNVVIEIKDNGNGLNREKIFNKAVEKGLIKPDEKISDQELFQFIFNAGFSTAEKVTNISGRGVGMDVVRKNIESLRGTIILDSVEGEGMSIKINLPLTLSIIDGFMFRINETKYVLPLDIVIECTESRQEELDTKAGGNFINLRGEVLPFMRLRKFFKEESEEPETLNVIIVRYKGKKAGLVVDGLLGELQTVIKPLGDIFSKRKWISGSTILGTGEVAIIIDTPNLISSIESMGKQENKNFKEVNSALH